METTKTELTLFGQWIEELSDHLKINDSELALGAVVSKSMLSKITHVSPPGKNIPQPGAVNRIWGALQQRAREIGFEYPVEVEQCVKNAAAPLGYVTEEQKRLSGAALLKY